MESGLPQWDMSRLAHLRVQHGDTSVIPAKAGIQGPCETCLTAD